MTTTAKKRKAGTTMRPRVFVVAVVLSAGAAASAAAAAFAPLAPSFAPPPPTARSHRSRPSPFLNANDGGGGEDDFYADFDPSEWEGYNRQHGYGGGGGYDNGGGDYGDYGDGRGRGRGRGGRRSRRDDDDDGWGPAAGGHDYVRDVDSDSSNVDVSAVDDLLSRRLRARKTGRFDEADAIRDELLSVHGVGVFDRERTWRTGCSASGSGMARPGRRRRRMDERGERGGRGRGGGRGRTYEERDFGPLGHDYVPSEDAVPFDEATCGVSEDDVHSLLAERLRSKLERDFVRADEIQARLAEAGVYVHDGRKEWRADGLPYGDAPGGGGGRGGGVKPGRERGSRADRESRGLSAEGGGGGERRRRTDWSTLDPSLGHDYVLSSGAGPNSSDMDEAEIHSLLAKRLRLKRERRFGAADGIQERLNGAGVYVHDRRREWRADGRPFDDLGNREQEEGRATATAAAGRAARDNVGGNDRGNDDDYEETPSSSSRAGAVRAVRRFRRGGRVELSVPEEGWAESSSSSETDSDEEISSLKLEMDESNAAEEAKGGEEDLGSLTVVQLKDRLRSAGLPVSGRKAELVERLLGARPKGPD